jgi:hypothetical protein
MNGRHSRRVRAGQVALGIVLVLRIAWFLAAMVVTGFCLYEFVSCANALHSTT